MKQLITLGLISTLLITSCLAPVVPEASSLQTSILKRLGHVGGSTIALAVQEDNLYLGYSTQFAILNIADRSKPELLATLPIPSTTIAVKGDYAYVGGSDGFFIIDVSVPISPVILSEIHFTNTVASIAIRNNLVYLLARSQLYILDVCNPAQPQQISKTDFPTTLESLKVYNDRALLTRTARIFEVDISNPEQIKTLRSFDFSGYTSRLALDGAQAYFVNDGMLYQFAVDSLDSPRAISKEALDYWVSDLAVVKGVTYLAAGSKGVEVWDLRDSLNPIQADSYRTKGMAIAVQVVDDTLFVIDCDEGLTILELSDPLHPTRVGNVATLGITLDIAINGHHAFVLSGFNGGLHVLDITQPKQAYIATTHFAEQKSYGFALIEHYLYLESEIGLMIFDVSDAENPIIIDFYPDFWGMNIQIVAPFAYIGDGDVGVMVLDISDPTQPELVRSYKDLGYAATLTVHNGSAYVLYGRAIRVLDMQENGELRQVASLAIEGLFGSMIGQGNYLYVADGEQGIFVVDVSDPAHPHPVGRYSNIGSESNQIRDLAIEGTYLFVAAGTQGVHVLDIRNPLQIVEVAAFATGDCATDVVVDNDLVYVADSLGGLFILEFEDSSK